MIGLAKDLIHPPKTVKRADGSTTTTAPKAEHIGKQAIKIKNQIDKAVGPKGER